MKLSALQQQCLQKMGIPIFEKRQSNVPDFLLYVDALDSPQKQQLLERIVSAMGSTLAKCIVKVGGDLCVGPDVGAHLVSAQKIVVFTDSVKMPETVVVLPSLEKMLKDNHAKKMAWQIIQKEILT